MNKRCEKCLHKADCKCDSNSYGYEYDSFLMVDTYKEFEDAESAKFERGEGLYCGENVIFTIDTNAKAEETLKITESQNLKEIINTWISNKGKEVVIDSQNWTFVAISVEVDDYYYVVENSGKRKYLSCVGRLDFK